MSVTAKAEGFDKGCACRRWSLQGGTAGVAVALPAGVAQLARGALLRPLRRSRAAPAGIPVPARQGRHRRRRQRRQLRPLPAPPCPPGDRLRAHAEPGRRASRQVPARRGDPVHRPVRPRRHRRAAHAGGRRRHGDGLLDRLADGIRHLSRPSRHRGADGDARQLYEGDVGFIKIDVEGHEQAVLDGAVQTIRRCRPRMLVEIDERLSPGGLARAKAYFRDLDYRGYFVQAGHIEPMSLFSASRPAEPGRSAGPHGAVAAAPTLRPLHLQFHLPAAR